MKKVLFFVASLAIVLPTYLFAVGAIAVDDEVGLKADEAGYYMATGEDSEASAKSAALKGCKALEGAKNCEVMVWFKQCGAYASSKELSGIGYGATKDIATKMALEACGGAGCKIAVADCE